MDKPIIVSTTTNKRQEGNIATLFKVAFVMKPEWLLVENYVSCGLGFAPM